MPEVGDQEGCREILYKITPVQRMRPPGNMKDMSAELWR